MSDFEYLPQDVALIKSTKFNLENSDRKGFLYGTLIGVPIGLAFNRQYLSKLGPGMLKVFVPLFTGSLIYHFYTRSARLEYNKTSERINRKYSLTINKILDY